MTLLSIERVEREPYDDVIITGGADGYPIKSRREPAPVEAFYELTIELDGERSVFDAEVRMTPRGYLLIDWDDELGDRMMECGLGRRAFDVLGNAVCAVHTGSATPLPMDLRSPPPVP